MKPTILHITIDYNNPHRGRPTRAIVNFIDRLEFADNIVISLRRSNNLKALWNRPILDPTDPKRRHIRLASMTYFGLPGGIGLFVSMRLVSYRIQVFLADNMIRPDLVHAHKLTFEGIASWLIATRRRIPLYASIRGEVEAKVLRYKPTYRRLYQRIINDADRLYFVSAWFLNDIALLISVNKDKVRFLPNEVKNETCDIFIEKPTKGLVTVLNLNDWKRKGLRELIEAIALLRDDGQRVALDIIGFGTLEAENQVRALLKKHRLLDLISMIGRVENAELLARLGHYIGLILPSRNETFGMVYAEALFAGIPVVMNCKSGIDGYLENIDVALYTRPGDTRDIAEKISILISDNEKFRHNIMSNSNVIFERFSTRRTIDQYQTDVSATVSLKKC